MSHFTGKRRVFQNAMCGRRFNGPVERDEHEAKCDECKRNHAILVAQSRPLT